MSSFLPTKDTFIDAVSPSESEVKRQTKEQRGVFCLDTFQLAVASRLSAQTSIAEVVFWSVL